MNKYREKTKTIEAVQFDPERFPWPECVIPWPDANGKPWRDMSWGYIYTAEGRAHVKASDWIVRGATGEPHICPPQVFESLYEPVDELDAPTSEKIYKNVMARIEADIKRQGGAL